MEENVQEQSVLIVDEMLVDQIARLRAKIEKHNQGKYSALAKYSDEGFQEYIVEQGLNAIDNALEVDIERRHREAFTKAMALLNPPKDPSNLAEMQKYATTIAKLREKFGIGGTAKEV